MQTKKALLVDIADKSKRLSDLLFVVSQALNHYQGEVAEIETCVGMAWCLSNSIGESTCILNPFPFTGVSDKHTNHPTPLNATCNGGLSLSDRIQLARENLGLSEADLARQLNTYSDHISDWECSITEVPASMIIPLANTLKCDPLWLLTGNNPEVAA